MNSTLKRTAIGLFFTLVILTLAAKALYSICPLYIKHPHINKVRYSHIPSLESALQLFRLDIGRYPTSAEGLDALLGKPLTVADDWEQYVQRLPRDPWGNEYVFISIKQHQRDFLLYSKGPNGADNYGEHDDIVNWEKSYQCHFYDTCPNQCDNAWSVAFAVSLLFSLAVTIYVLYFLSKAIRNKKDA